MAENEDFLSIRQTAEILGLTVAQTKDLLRSHVLESRTGVLRSSVNRYLAGLPA